MQHGVERTLSECIATSKLGPSRALVHGDGAEPMF